MKHKRLPPVKSRPPRRKGNHKANPYEDGVDREGKPHETYKHTEVTASFQVTEPTFVLRGSDPLAAIIVRFWAGLAADMALQPPDVVAEARRRALSMDLWRSAQNPAAGRAGAG